MARTETEAERRRRLGLDPALPPPRFPKLIRPPTKPDERIVLGPGGEIVQPKEETGEIKLIPSNATFTGKTQEEVSKGRVGGAGDVDGGSGFLELGRFKDFTTVTLPDGKKVLFKDEGEAREFLNRQIKSAEIPTGAVSLAVGERIRAGQKLAGQVGQIGDVDVTQGVNLNEKQALLVGLRGAIPAALTGGAAVAGTVFAAGKIGALAGAPGGPGGVAVGAAAGATVGLVVGFYSAYTGNLKAQAAGEISASSIALREGKQQLLRIASTAWSGRGDPVILADSFERALTDIEREYRTLELDTGEDLNLFLGEDGTPVLQRYEEFYRRSRPLLIDEFRQALASPPDEERALALLTADDITAIQAGNFGLT